MTDPFLKFVRSACPAGKVGQTVSSKVHTGRAHSKFSASGAERWFRCPGSVELSEGKPDKPSKWSIEGTRAHEVLEELLIAAISVGSTKIGCAKFDSRFPREMIQHCVNAANFILARHAGTPDSEILVETKIHLDFIHPEMFGTFDGAVIDHFGTLHVLDFKYGAGCPVSVRENLQMIFYAVGLAYLYHWNFKRVRMWIIQPRIKGYDGPTFWDISIAELRAYVGEFRKAVRRVERYPRRFKEGPHCQWCKGRPDCPLKRKKKLDTINSVFTNLPVKR